jgi:magnesium chelatase family protein
MTMAASARGIDTVFVPEPQTGEAAMVPGLRVFGIRSLAQVIALLTGGEVPEAPEVEGLSGAALVSWRGEGRLDDVDMADLVGLEDTRYAVEVAAAGGHHLMLTGPKGSGKTTIAERIPGLLPDLAEDESLELTAVHSLCGALPDGAARLVRPPFRAPHHSASRSGVLGGGTGRVRPGEVSKAHLGVLFLDEFPQFPTDVIEALREPLEAGQISIARGDEEATYPARAMFVFACNPCPCGEYSTVSRDHRCRCRETQRRDYRNRISGPIADRIDITRFVEPVKRAQQEGQPLPFERPEPTATIRARVTKARQRQAARYADCPWRLNGQAPGPALRQHWPLTDAASRQLEEQVYAGKLTRRGAVRVHRVAWSIADLAGIEQPGVHELDVALRLRAGEPLMLDSIPVRGVPIRAVPDVGESA